LPPSAFTPPPKVTSAVVVFRPKEKGALKPDISIIERLTKEAFGQRRKMIRSSLKSYLPAIEALDIPPTARAEELDVETFIKLAAKVEALKL
jgi:16S rRNA (adenine1518-N6/adenine1519-N6)-dimethyltransferase